MRQLLPIIAFLFLISCNSLEFEKQFENTMVSAYIDKKYWSADSLMEAYYFENYLFIAAKMNDENLILKIKNPLIGDNSNVEIEYISSSKKKEISITSNNVSMYLNVLDTINAEPSVVNGTFSGLLSLNNGEKIKIQEGKINNIITKNLFCENSIVSKLSSNNDIGGKWEFVKIINKKEKSVQYPICDEDKVYLNFYNENYLPEKINDCNCNFLLEGSSNLFWGNYNVSGINEVSFLNSENTKNESANYEFIFEGLINNCILNSTEYYINNSLMHLESDECIVVFYRSN